MRVVVDTNVWISAALKENSTPAMVARLIAARCTVLKSTATETELTKVLSRPRLAPLISAPSRRWLTGLLAMAETVAITESIAACRDPDDDKFLELAVNGRADSIVSGDADLLSLNPFREIPIVGPAEFASRLLSG